MNEELAEIKSLEINTATPFLLHVLHDYATDKIDKSALLGVLRLVQTYVWRRFVVNLATNTLNKTFTTLYDAVDYEDYVGGYTRSLLFRRGSARFPRDKEVRSTLRERDMYHIRRKNRDYMFRQLEGFNNRETVDLSTLTVEHIFPQNPAEAWRRDMDDDEFARFADLYLHRLGNLTLSGNNGKLGNKAFIEKRDMNQGGGEQGYVYSRLFLNRDLHSLDHWDEQAFEARTDRLIDRMFDIWPLPEVAQQAAAEVEFTPLEDVDSVTGSRIIDARIGGLATGPMSFADLTRRVLRKFYESDRYNMRNAEVMDALNARATGESLRNPYDIAPGYFVEMHSSSDEKLRLLQRAIAHLEQEGEVEVAFDDAS